MTQSDDDREKRQDVAHAARSGGMQVITVAAQALPSVTHVLLARFFGRAVFGVYGATLLALGLAPEERRLVSGAWARLRAGRDRRDA